MERAINHVNVVCGRLIELEGEDSVGGIFKIWCELLVDLKAENADKLLSLCERLDHVNKRMNESEWLSAESKLSQEGKIHALEAR